MSKCSKCSGKMDKYYGSWCPRCEKPEPVTFQSFNLLQVMRHLISIGEFTEEDRERAWHNLTNSYIAGNDSYFSCSFADLASDVESDLQDADDTDAEDISAAKVFRAIVKHFGEEEYLWEVSW